jgi:phosphatidylglycerophosphatase C
MKQLVLFDFDETITSRDSYPLFLRYITLASKWYKYIFALPRLAAFFLRLTDPGKSKAVILKLFVGSASKETIEAKARDFIEYLFAQRIILPDMTQRMKSYQAGGSTVVVVSASPDLWIRPFCEKMGVECICTELEYAGQYFTGKLSTPNCNGPEKERRIRAAFDLSLYASIIVYGHGKGDREMLALATGEGPR